MLNAAFQEITFGHRYLAISFMMAQSAFLCSLFETVCSESKESVLGASFVFTVSTFWKVSGLMLSGISRFSKDSLWTFFGVRSSCHGMRDPVNCRVTSRHRIDWYGDHLAAGTEHTCDLVKRVSIVNK